MRATSLRLALAGSLLATSALITAGSSVALAADASGSPSPTPTLSPAQAAKVGALVSYFKAKNTIVVAKASRAATTSVSKRSALTRTISRATRVATAARARVGTIPTVVTTSVVEPCNATATTAGSPLGFSIGVPGAPGTRYVVTLTAPGGRIAPGTRIANASSRISVSSGAPKAGTYVARAYSLGSPIALVAECSATVAAAASASPTPSPSSSAAPAASTAAIAAPVFDKVPTNGERGGIFTWAAVDGAASYQCAYTLSGGTLSYGACSGERSYTVSASLGAVITVSVRGVTAAGAVGPAKTYTWTVTQDGAMA